MACTLPLLLVASAVASELSITVRQPGGAPVVGAVVIAEPVAPAPPARGTQRAIVNQKDLRFLPDILVVRTGTAVDFPNGDPVRHQVYSFSSARKFQLSLYSGSAHAPVQFDTPGLVTLGCNIHDSMIGYIVVTDSPWFGRTGKAGELSLRELPAGQYTVRLWHPRIKDTADSLARSVTLGAIDRQSIEYTLKKALTPGAHNNGTAKQWEDY
jgi:plastocyanin